VYNEWRERRRNNLCSRHAAKERGASSISHASSRQRPAGRGARTPIKTGTGGYSPSHGAYVAGAVVLPQNHREIYQTIADSLPNGLSIQTEAPLTT